MNIVIANRQRRRKINTQLLKQIANALLAELKVENAEIGIILVGAREMTLVNETFLHHEGSTDVITFDHLQLESPGKKPEMKIHGEMFICLDDAITQAKQFGTIWQSEITRYVIHGVLHLLGHDDLKPHLRRNMKREENRLLRKLSNKFSLAQIGGGSKLRA
jgi:probable rRNA maturation factor